MANKKLTIEVPPDVLQKLSTEQGKRRGAGQDNWSFQAIVLDAILPGRKADPKKQNRGPAKKS